MSYFQKIYRSELNHRARAVYMYLKDHADREGKCWPGIRTMARELGPETQQLCAAALEFPHPLTGQAVVIRSNLRPFFPDLPENFPFDS